MPADEKLEQTPREAEVSESEMAELMNAPIPSPDDPGGSHTKGYSADPLPGGVVPDQDPVPLAPAPDVDHAIKVPERDNHVTPTGRDKPHPYTPNDRLMGADR